MTGTLDWAAARARMHHARAALEAERTPAAEHALLQARAHTLAQPLPDAADAADTLDIVVFVLGGERFAVDAAQVLAAAPLGEPTPVPGTPAVLLGVVNQRGRVVPVMDLRRHLTPDASPTALTHLVTVAVDGMLFGIAVESVLETTRERATAGEVTDALLTVLDLEMLAADPRLRIDDD